MTDAVAFLFWSLSNLILAAASWRVATRLYPRHGLALPLGAAITGTVVTIQTVAILLGQVGWLSGTSLILATTVLGLTVLIALPACRGRRAGRIRLFPLLAWGGAAVFLGTHVVVNGLLRLPTDFDCLMYHLPVIDEWIQSGRLNVPTSSYWWTPGASELIGLWMAAPFSGDFLAALNNVPFVVLWATATYGLSRELGLPEGWAHLAAWGSLLTHTTLHETDDASNDLAVAAFFVTAAWFALRGVRARRSQPAPSLLGIDRETWLCGLSLGGLIGVKYFAVGYAVTVVAALAIGGWRTSCGTLSRLGWACGVMLVVGGYWYLRNWVVGGSPVYPMGIGRDLATGYPDLWRTTLFFNGDPSVPWLGLQAIGRLTGPVHGLAVLAAPLVCGVALLRCNRSRWLFLAVLLLGAGGVWLLSPFCVEDVPGTMNHLRWGYTPVRYGLCFLTAAVLGTVALVGERRTLGRRNGYWRKVVWSAAVLLLTVQTSQRLWHGYQEFQLPRVAAVAAPACLSVVLLILCAAERPWRVRRQILAAAGVFLMFGGAWAVMQLSDRWHQHYGVHFDELFGTSVFGGSVRPSGPSIRLASETEPQSVPVQRPWGQRICALDLRVYPYFGSRRETQVIRARATPSLSWLTEYLRVHQVQFIAVSNVATDAWLYGAVPRWLQDHPELFAPICRQGQTAIYRVRVQSSEPSHRGCEKIGTGTSQTVESPGCFAVLARSQSHFFTASRRVGR